MNALGFEKSPADTRVVVAMSGGVDSSVVAALLHEQGYDVVGVTLQLYDYGQALRKKGACCAGQDIRDAAKVAQARGFPHYVLDYESRFRESVVEDFADSYLRGETPIPCIRCNQSVKFRDLVRVARDLGADCLATGHYVRRTMTGSGAQMERAADPHKDQSYFLFATTQEQLDFLRFPLGETTKDATRAQAQRLGLAVAAKPDSQDICFVPGGDYAAVVKMMRPDAHKPGEIVDGQGRVLGRHEGIVGYTVGQRRGLGIGGGFTDNNEPLYVTRLDPARNRVIVGPKAALAHRTLTIRDCNWLAAAPDGDGPFAVDLKVRSAMPPVKARLSRIAPGQARIALDAPHYGIAPGQAAVCYRGAVLIGGGWIAGTQAPQDAPALDKPEEKGR